MTWKKRLDESIPLLGHRNWILIADSAYPLQTSPGIETIETNAEHVEVVQAVLRELDKSGHVRAVVFMDAELSYVSEKDAPGVGKYRDRIKKVFGSRDVTLLPHEQIIGRIDEAGKTFHVFVLKTTLAIPYTSVFLRLDCKYWSDSAEASMRKAISDAHAC